MIFLIIHNEYQNRGGEESVVEFQRKKGRKVAVFPVSGNDWMDMGQLPELEKMRIKLYGE